MSGKNLKLRLHLIKRVVITYIPYSGSIISIDISHDGRIIVDDNGVRKTFSDTDLTERTLQYALGNIFLDELLEGEINGQDEEAAWKIEFYNRLRLDHTAYGSEKTSLNAWSDLITFINRIEGQIHVDLGTKHLNTFYETKREENGKPAVASDEMRSVYYHIMTGLLPRIMEKDTDNESNMMISPLSLIYALAILLEAADGVTRCELETLFDNKYNEIEADLTSLMKDCSRSSSQLRVANCIYVDQDYLSDISSHYLEMISDKYSADCISAAFGDISKTVNDWVNKKTHGLIKRMLGDDDRLNTLALLNALTFEAKWFEPYEDEDIETDVFHNEDGTESKVSMLCSKESTFLINSKVIGFLKPYLEYEYYFAGILPSRGYTVTRVMKEMTSKEWKHLFEKSRRADVRVRIPEYMFQYEDDFSDILTEFGVTSAFNPSQADLRNMIPYGGAFLKKVVQKTYIEVNRKGTRASVVTGAIAAAGGSPYERYEVYLDRPFIFAIIHRGTRVPVFIGSVKDMKNQ